MPLPDSQTPFTRVRTKIYERTKLHGSASVRLHGILGPVQVFEWRTAALQSVTQNLHGSG